MISRDEGARRTGTEIASRMRSAADAEGRGQVLAGQGNGRKPAVTAADTRHDRQWEDREAAEAQARSTPRRRSRAGPAASVDPPSPSEWPIVPSRGSPPSPGRARGSPRSAHGARISPTISPIPQTPPASSRSQLATAPAQTGPSRNGDNERSERGNGEDRHGHDRAAKRQQ